MNHNDNKSDFELDFEKQYIEYSKNDAPDLWARIEAGLPGSNPRVRRSFKWYRYAPLVAACVCLVIIVPALKSVMFGAKSDSAKEEFAFDSVGDSNDMSSESVSAPDMDDFMNADGYYSDAKTESAENDSYPMDSVVTEEAEDMEESVAPEADRDQVCEDTAGSEMEKVSSVECVVAVLANDMTEYSEDVYYLCEVLKGVEAYSIYIKSEDILNIGENYALEIELLRETFNELPVYRLIQYVE